MIAYLQGNIRAKTEKGIILDTGGVGYLVHLPLTILEKVNEQDEVEFFIETRVREDDISLYGFETFEQLQLFQTVTSISGVGAKIGLELLAQDPDKIKSAIAAKDTQYLSKIHGVGKKTAERLIVELKNKIGWNGSQSAHRGLNDEESNDAENALLSLGYQKYEIRKILKDMPDNIKDVEDIVTYFLQNV